MIPRQTLEINTSHPVIVQLNTLRTSNPAYAVLIAEQLFDNALVAAGLLDDPRTMLPRLNRLLEVLASEFPSTVVAPPAPLETSPYPAEAEEKQVQDFMHDAFSDVAGVKK
jgi:hypothetical protein